MWGYAPPSFSRWADQPDFPVWCPARWITHQPDVPDTRYALNVADQINPYSCGDNDNQCPSFWPFETSWWKPKNTRSDLIRAAALIVAEIERFDRNPI